MNAKQKEYCDKMELIFSKASDNVTYRTKDGSPPHERGMILLYEIIANTSPAPYLAKQEYIGIVNSIIETSHHNNKIDKKITDERKAEHLAALDKVTSHILPLDPIKRAERVGSIKRCYDIIDKNEYGLGSISQERLKGSIGWLLHTILQDLPDAYSRRSIRAKFGGNGSNRMNEFGRVRVQKVIDPNIMLVLADLIQIVPAIWENDLFKRVLVENEFLNQIYIQLASGESSKKAIDITLGNIGTKNPAIYNELFRLITSILKTEDLCYTVADKSVKNNIITVYQMEVIHRYLTNKEKYLFVFDEPGTRKTVTSVIAMILRLNKDGYRHGRILAIVPPHLMDNWISDVSSRLLNSVVEIRPIHYGILNGKTELYRPNGKFQIEVIGNTCFSIDKFQNLPKDYVAVITDEVHNFKKRDGTPESKRSGTVIQFINEAKIEYREMLTGTPLVNDPTEYAHLVNSFAGNNILDMAHLRAIASPINRACYIHLITSKVVIRRCKDYIMDLPPINIIEEPVILDYKQVGLIKSMDSYVNRARHEAICKINYVNCILNRPENINSKGLIFSNFVDGTPKADLGIIRSHYEKCPSYRKKVLITGSELIDINGHKLKYSLFNARIIRKQFEESLDPVVAYVSVKTCREGINEFKCGDFVIWAILPYDWASLDQANSRIHRDGRDKEKECRIYIPICHYINKKGKPERNPRTYKLVKSYDERCLNLILKKRDLLTATCDGIKKGMNGSLARWKDINDDSFADMEEWARGKDKEHKFNAQRYITDYMNDLQKMDQIDSDIIFDTIEAVNETLLEYNVKSGDFFDLMENLKTAKDSKTLIDQEASALFTGPSKINSVHLGCGKAKLTDSFLSKCNEFYRVDKYCEEKGIINCDRSEMSSHISPDSIDYLMATDVMHWDAKADNLDGTMFSINEVLKTDGHCLITSPVAWKYPFATNDRFLKSKGFKMIKSKKYGSIRYYLLKKISGHQNSKVMSQSLLPRKIDYVN